MTKFNFYWGSAVSSWLLVILIVAAELYEPFKNLLKSVFTHHWIGKGVIIALAFLVFGFLLRDKNSVGKFSDEKIAWFSVIASLTVILLFFIIEFFK